MDVLSEKIEMLSEDVRALETDPGCVERMRSLESEFLVCDRLVECSRQSPGALEAYRRLRHRYRRVSDPCSLDREIAACRVHMEALGRQRRIEEIANSVQEIVAVSEYISLAVGDGYCIDNLAQHLEQAEAYGEMANEQLLCARERKSWRRGLVRSLLLLVLGLAAAVGLARLVF